MPIYVDQEKNLTFLFVHVPKCGGGSIESFFRKNKYSEQLFSMNPLGLRKCSPQHMHAAMLESVLNINRFDYVFAVVRNPVSRIISEYKWQIGRSIAKDGIDSWYDIARKKFLENNFKFDNHMRPMHEFIVNGCNVFRLEDGLSDLPEKIELELKGLGVSGLWTVKEIVNQKHNWHQKALDKEPSLKSRFDHALPSKGTVLKIIRDYETDFKRFGYSLNVDDYLS